jgi:hypothetical protein
MRIDRSLAVCSGPTARSRSAALSPQLNNQVHFVNASLDVVFAESFGSGCVAAHLDRAPGLPSSWQPA